MPHRIAYMPLNTYPEAAPDAAILAAVGFAAALECGLHVTNFAVDVPTTASPIGGFFINVEGMARAAEERSMADCARLQALVQGAGGAKAGRVRHEAKGDDGGGFGGVSNRGSDL